MASSQKLNAYLLYGLSKILRKMCCTLKIVFPSAHSPTLSLSTPTAGNLSTAATMATTMAITMRNQLAELSPMLPLVTRGREAEMILT